MNTERYYRAYEIYTQPATSKRAERRGILPIKRSQFYALVKEGKFPKHDNKIGDTPLWSEDLIRSAVSESRWALNN